MSGIPKKRLRNIWALHITLPSTIAPPVLDSKPLRAFSPVMAGVRHKMEHQMGKIIKKVLGLIALLGAGLIYGLTMRTVDEMREQQIYSYLSFKAPNSEAVMTYLKKVPESKCEKWRKDYFESSMQYCNDCTVLHNSCTSIIPAEYIPTFEQKKLDFPYIYRPYKYPEVAIISGFPKGSFSQYCEIEKQQFSKSVCIQ